MSWDETTASKMVAHMARTEEVLNKVDERLDRHHETLYGDQGTPGIDKKVDRIEQAAKAAKVREDRMFKVILTTISGVIALVIETGWRKLGL